MKMSKKMIEVLQKMNEGWELGQEISFVGGWRLQLGGIGRGGISTTVNTHTAMGLFDRNMIEVHKRGFPTQTYKLSEQASVFLSDYSKRAKNV